ncbi:MAG: hypothetical protein WC495_02300 [Patescibacteria group bacterium]|jgi:hypothetical protein
MIIVITDSLGTGAARAVYKLTSKLTLGEVIEQQIQSIKVWSILFKLRVQHE